MGEGGGGLGGGGDEGGCGGRRGGRGGDGGDDGYRTYTYVFQSSWGFHELQSLLIQMLAHMHVPSPPSMKLMYRPPSAHERVCCAMAPHSSWVLAPLNVQPSLLKGAFT